MIHEIAWVCGLNERADYRYREAISQNHRLIQHTYNQADQALNAITSQKLELIIFTTLWLNPGKGYPIQQPGKDYGYDNIGLDLIQRIKMMGNKDTLLAVIGSELQHPGLFQKLKESGATEIIDEQQHQTYPDRARELYSIANKYLRPKPFQQYRKELELFRKQG